MVGALGFGAVPFGTGPYGIGTPAATAPLGGSALTMTDGTRGTCRKIDPGTRQYVYDATGRAVGDTTVHQLVQMVATTTLASAAVTGLGHNLASIKDITPNFASRVQGIFTTAYARLVARGMIILLGVDVLVVPPSKALIVIRYRDLSTGQDGEVTA